MVQASELNVEKVLEHWSPAHALREVIANALDEHALVGRRDLPSTPPPSDIGCFSRRVADRLRSVELDGPIRKVVLDGDGARPPIDDERLGGPLLEHVHVAILEEEVDVVVAC